MQNNSRFDPPVRVDEELTVTIEGTGEKGDGVARVKNFVIFVPNTKEGDHVKIRITKVFSKLGFGEVIGEGDGARSEPFHPRERVTEEDLQLEEESELIHNADDSEDFGED